MHALPVTFLFELTRTITQSASAYLLIWPSRDPRS